MKVVVFIHGYLSYTDDFCNLPDQLAPYYDKVFLLGLPGSGPDDNIKDFTYENVLIYVEKTIADIYKEYDEVDIIGYSLGGAIARGIAARYPVNKMILLTPACKYLFTKFLINQMNRWYQIETNSDLTKEEKKEQHKKFKQRNNFAFRFGKERIIKKFRLDNGYAFCKIVQYYNKFSGPITPPTLIIWGYLDEMVPYASVKKCLKDCTNPKSELVVIKDIGHMMLRTDHEPEITSKIIEFITEGE